MQIPVQELLGDFLREARVSVVDTGLDIWLQQLLDDAESSSAVLKRDMRRLLEKDPPEFLQSACRIMKTCSQKPGSASMMDLLWSSPVLIASLIDPSMLPLRTAIAFANRWVAFDPMLDIKLLEVAFPFGEDDAESAVDEVGSQRALEIVSKLPPNRHILQLLSRLLRSPDPYVKSKAALLYARASDNPEWVRKMLADPDVRVRANAVEGLWKTKAAAAGAVFREAALDTDYRVEINALLGLHYIGDTTVDVRAALEKMTGAAKPVVRAAAAFAMGRIMDAIYIPVLEGLLRDHDQQVRGQALRALIGIRRRPDEAPSEQAEPLPGSAAEETSDPHSTKPRRWKGSTPDCLERC